MSNPSEYPKDWRKIRGLIRADADGNCERCGRELLKPGEQPKSRKDRYQRQPNRHHKDRNRANCEPSNILILCPGCHLLLHRPERNGARYDNGQLEIDFTDS